MIQNKSCKYEMQTFPTIFKVSCGALDDHGLKSWVFCENHASETQNAQVKKSLSIDGFSEPQ